MKYIKLLFSLIVATAFIGCREDDPQLQNPNYPNEMKTWDDVFEVYWNAMNNSYAYWDIDTTNWDKIYTDYKPQFRDLKFGNKEDSTKVKKLFSEITSGLIDHHYALIFFKDNQRVWTYFLPGAEEVKKRSYYHNEYGLYYLKKTEQANIDNGRISHYSTASYTVKDVGLLSVSSYLLDKDIAYFRLNRFALVSSINDAKVKATIDNFHNLVDNTPGLKGVIIDTRNNGGGNVSDLSILISPLISKSYTLGYNRTKNGMGRLDFSPWSPYIIFPSKESNTLRKIESVPVVALADVNSVSMGEITPFVIKQLPQGYVVGERTWGGHGVLTGNFNDTFGGLVKNSVFEIYTTTCMFKAPDGKSYEGKGITPDLEALYDESEFKKGNDTQLDKAIKFIGDKSK